MVAVQPFGGAVPNYSEDFWRTKKQRWGHMCPLTGPTIDYYRIPLLKKTTMQEIQPMKLSLSTASGAYIEICHPLIRLYCDDKDWFF